MKSIEKQLLTSLTIALVLILIGQLIIANLSTRNILNEFITSRLELDAERLLESLELQADRLFVHRRHINPIYNSAFSGHYYSIKIKRQGAMDDVVLLSPSLQNHKLFFSTSSFPNTVHDISGPKGQHLIIWTQKYNKSGYEVFITVAENMSTLMKKRQRFTVIFILIGVVGFFLLLALQRYVVRRLFKHLDHSRNEIIEVEVGKRQSLSEDVPSEIYPLVKEFNHTLSLMQQRLERSRNSLGNLAHALKTPLSILMQNLESDENRDKEHLKSQAKRIQKLMERELKRARMAGLGNSSQRFLPQEELEVLSDVLRQANKRERLLFNFLIDENITSFGDREDMLELFGNLLDNACKWAKKEVLCSIKKSIEKSGESINICIEDDGDGQASSELSELTNRGIRIDETVDGHGLGLAICKDIVKLYGGTMSFNHSVKLGGFQVNIKLPNV